MIIYKKIISLILLLTLSDCGNDNYDHSNIALDNNLINISTKLSRDGLHKIEIKTERGKNSEVYLSRNNESVKKITNNNYLEYEIAVNNAGEYAYIEFRPDFKNNYKNVFLNNSSILQLLSSDDPRNLFLTNSHILFTNTNYSSEVLDSERNEIYSSDLSSISFKKITLPGFIKSVFELSENIFLFHIFIPSNNSSEIWIFDVKNNSLSKKEARSYKFIFANNANSLLGINILGNSKEINFFKTSLEWNRQNFSIPYANTTNDWGLFSWSYSYDLRGLIDLQLITKNLELKNEINKTVEAFLYTSNKYRNPSLTSLSPNLWAAKKYTIDGSYLDNLDEGSLIIYPMLKALNNNLLDNKYEANVITSAKELFNFYETDFNSLDSLYRFKYGTRFRWDGVWQPFNKQSNLGLVLMELIKNTSTNSMVYSSRLNQLATSFKNEITIFQENKLSWNYWPQKFYDGWKASDAISFNTPSHPSSIGGPVGLSYAGIDIEFIVNFIKENGHTVFSENDILFLQNNLENIFNQNGFSPILTGSISKSSFIYQPSYGWIFVDYSDLLTNSYSNYVYNLGARKWALLQDKTYYLQNSPNFSIEIYKLDSDLNETFFETRTFSYWNDVITFLKNL